MIKTKYGLMQVLDNDFIASKSLKMYGEWASNELAVFKEFISPGDVVFDIGAYIGSHSLAFSSFVGDSGKVFSFEVYPEFFQLLKKNTEQVKNIDCEMIGLSDQKKTLLVDAIDTSSKGNFGGSNFDSNKENAAISVTFTTLNDIFFNKIAFKDTHNQVHFMKMDIEGMELEALSGGIDVLTNCKPVIFTEVNSISSGVKLMAYMAAFAYEPFGVLTSAFNPNNFNKNHNNIFASCKETGIIFIERDSLIKWEDTITKLKLPHLETFDDLALLMLHKPQYPHEILQKTSAFEVLGAPK